MRLIGILVLLGLAAAPAAADEAGDGVFALIDARLE